MTAVPVLGRDAYSASSYGGNVNVCRAGAAQPAKIPAVRIIVKVLFTIFSFMCLIELVLCIRFSRTNLRYVHLLRPKFLPFFSQ